MNYLELLTFSQSPEIIQKKTDIFDEIAEKCEGEELSQAVAMYQIYLEYIEDVSGDVDSYMEKLQLFEDMLQDEFDDGWNWSYFLERYISMVSEGVWRRVIRYLRVIKSSITNNLLEASILVASFCPYAGDVLDIGYGAYKYSTGENFSGDEVGSGDACIQIGFGMVGLGMNVLFPGAGSLVKTLKVFSKTVPEVQFIKRIGEKIMEYVPDIIRIMQGFGDNLLEGLKVLKEFFMQRILPVIRGEIEELYAMIRG